MSEPPRGLSRHLALVIDLSRAAQDKDYPPTRGRCLAKAAQAFVERYFLENQLSQLGLVVGSDAQARQRTVLGRSPRAQTQAIASALAEVCFASWHNVWPILVSHCAVTDITIAAASLPRRKARMQL